ncbi:MAG: acyltransferase [Lachnospiraceae bacterium]|nr:acyltransferase [Lachnospiraceae bacterium]
MYLITNWGSVVDISKSAKVILHSHFAINTPKYKHSREEAYVLLRDGAELTINGSVTLASRSTIQVQKDAKLAIGTAHINHESSIIIGGNTTIGDGILISRDVKIFDSDFHKVLDEDGNQTNNTKPMRIGNHVWIGLGAIILRGSQIGDGAVISAGSVVMGKIKAGTNAIGNPARSFSNIRWEA